jgi:hypothetical protein
MDTREALIEEIRRQPELLQRELHRYLKVLLEQQDRETGGLAPVPADEWPDHYFEATAGAFADEPFERPSQVPPEQREEW